MQKQNHHGGGNRRNARIYPDLFYRLWIRRDTGGCAAGEMAAHDVERRQVREGDVDEQREDESIEEEDDARDEINMCVHDCGK